MLYCKAQDIVKKSRAPNKRGMNSLLNVFRNSRKFPRSESVCCIIALPWSMIQWKPLNRDASGVRILSRITDCPDYPMQFLLLDMNLF